MLTFSIHLLFAQTKADTIRLSKVVLSCGCTRRAAGILSCMGIPLDLFKHDLFDISSQVDEHTSPVLLCCDNADGGHDTMSQVIFFKVKFSFILSAWSQMLSSWGELPD